MPSKEEERHSARRSSSVTQGTAFGSLGAWPHRCVLSLHPALRSWISQLVGAGPSTILSSVSQELLVHQYSLPSCRFASCGAHDVVRSFFVDILPKFGRLMEGVSSMLLSDGDSCWIVPSCMSKEGEHLKWLVQFLPAPSCVGTAVWDAIGRWSHPKGRVRLNSINHRSKLF